MKIYIPLQDKVLVEQHKAASQVSGYHIPEAERGKTNTGTVIRASEQTPFEPGQDIIYDKFVNPMTFKEGDKEYIILSEKNIYGFIKDDGTE